MKLKKIFPYNIKKALPVLGLAGASLFMAGCEKDEPVAPTTDVEIEICYFSLDRLFYEDNGIVKPSELAQYYVSKPEVGNIYILSSGSWSSYNSYKIHDLRKNALEHVFNYSSKFKGKGDFNFDLGEASKVPEDSLWYVSKGWTINKRYSESRSR